MRQCYANGVRDQLAYFALGLFFTGACMFTSCTKMNALAPETNAAGTSVNLKTDAGSTDTYQKIFTGNTEGYHSYRIPSIVRTVTNQVLIAFCEGRDDNSFDYGDINIVCKRSFDQGATWGPIKAVVGPGNYTDGNPTAVVDPTTNRVWLFYLHSDSTHYTQADGHTYKPFAVGDRRVMMVYSDDEGDHWSAPQDMTSTTTPSNTAQDYVGPGTGIYKTHGTNAGYLIIPAYGRNIYSSDHGANWTYSPIDSGTYRSTEASIVEKLDGTLMRNDRATSSQAFARRVATGTLSNHFPASAWYSDTQLPDPKMQASNVRYNDPKPNRIMFLNSNSTQYRRYMRVRITYNEGQTWERYQDFPQHGTGILGGYSSMVKTYDANIGALIEYNENDTASHRSIEFHKFGLQWILQGQSEPTGY